MDEVQAKFEGAPACGDALTEPDALALDAYFGEAGGRSPSAERLARMASALSLLELTSLEATDGTWRRALVDATVARAMRATRASIAPEPSLDATDAAAVDALVENGWSAEAVAGPTGERARRLERALASLGGTPVGVGMTGELLVDATLSRVDAEIRRREALLRAAALEGREAARGRFTLSDLVTVAAMLAFAFGVLWPMAASWRESARQVACADNLGTTASAFDMYARDHQGQMPVATAGFGGGPWWRVGDPGHSHSANLFRLAKSGYASLAELSCSGNSSALVRGNARAMDDWRSIDEVSFSYQLPSRPVMIWSTPSRVVVLADKSPVIERAVRGERFDPEARSLNHRGRGQNVLMSDGSVIFLTRPVLENGDNIWLPEFLEDRPAARLTGMERPARETDAFVAP